MTHFKIYKNRISSLLLLMMAFCLTGISKTGLSIKPNSTYPLITPPAPLSLTYTLKQARTDAPSQKLGEVSFGANGGAAPYTYRLDNVIISSPLNLKLTQGTHVLQVTDANNTIERQTIEVANAIQWKYTQNVSVQANATLLKQNTTTAWGNAGAIAMNTLGPDQNGWIQYTIPDQTQELIFGFSDPGNTTYAFDDLREGFYVSGRNLYAVERGSIIAQLPDIGSGQVLRLERQNNQLYFYVDGISYYDIAVTPASDYRLKVSIYEHNSTASGVFLTSFFSTPLLANTLVEHVTSYNLNGGVISMAGSGGVKPYQFNDIATGESYGWQGLGIGQYTLTMVDSVLDTLRRVVAVGVQPLWKKLNNLNWNQPVTLTNPANKGYALSHNSSYPNESAWFSFKINDQQSDVLFGLMGIPASAMDTTQVPYMATDAYLNPKLQALNDLMDLANAGNLNYSSGTLQLPSAQENLFTARLQQNTIRLLVNGAQNRNYSVKSGDVVAVGRLGNGAIYLSINGQVQTTVSLSVSQLYLLSAYLQRSGSALVSEAGIYTSASPQALPYRLKMGGVCYTDACRRSTTSRVFDENGGIQSESKQFTDQLGRPTQAQQRLNTNSSVLASETIYDAFGRAAGQTLAAPMGDTRLCYASTFFVNTGGQHFNSGNFEATAPNGNTTSGSLGWYYSDNNTLDGLVPADQYPYTKTEFSKDPLGRVIRQAGVGVDHKAGSGHEVSMTYTNSVAELWKVFQPNATNHTYLLNDDFTFMGNSLTDHVYKTITVNPDGHSSVAFKNGAGQLLATCSTGADAGCAASTVSNELDINKRVLIHLPKLHNGTLKVKDPSQFNYFNPELYLYTTKQKLVAGVDYVWTTLSATEKQASFMGVYATQDLFLEVVGAYPVGSSTPGSGAQLYPIESTHQCGYTNWTLYYYDLQGRVKAIQSPEDIQCSGSIVPTTFMVNGQGGSTPFGCDNGGTVSSVNLSLPGSNPDLRLSRVKLTLKPGFTLFDTIPTTANSRAYTLQTNAASGLKDSTMMLFPTVEVVKTQTITIDTNTVQWYLFDTLNLMHRAYKPNEHARHWLMGKSVRFTGKYVYGLRNASGQTTWYPAKAVDFNYELVLDGEHSRFVNHAGAGDLQLTVDELLEPGSSELVVKTESIALQLSGFYNAPQIAFNPCALNYYVPANAASLINAISANIQLSASAQLQASTLPVANPVLPKFSKKYWYNEYGHSIATESAEEGKTEFLYDTREGKLLFSQNAQQKAENGKFSYITYDDLGRVKESGIYDPSISVPSNGVYAFQNYFDIKNNVALPSGKISLSGFVSSGNSMQGQNSNKTEQTFLTYDLPDGTHPSGNSAQKYLNGMLAKSENDYSTTWYSYNSRGELSSSTQNIVGLGVKTTQYTYDYFGNLDVLGFQMGNAPEVIQHVFLKDADKRPIYSGYARNSLSGLALLSSLNSANYLSFYPHGAVKRSVIGNNLQGLDFVYTLNGALKAVNNPDDLVQGQGWTDPGRDGTSFGACPNADVFGFTLDYYPGDYKRNTGVAYHKIPNNGAFGALNISYTGQVHQQRWQRLYNPPLSTPANSNPNYYEYNYDEQYRLTGASNGRYQASGSSNTIPLSVTDSYKLSGISYDRNGNLKTLKRWGITNAATNTSNLIDDLTYGYYGGATVNTLRKVSDAVSTGYGLSPEMDLPDQSNVNNYRYNAIGQMTMNLQENQQYTYYGSGLVKEIRNPVNNLKVAEFTYNDKGLRNSKTSYNSSGVVIGTQYYVYDAGGGLLATYEKLNGQSSASMKEYVLFGAAGGRAGMLDAGTNKGYFELSDQLGNVRTVVSAKTGGGVEVIEMGDYYPHGGIMPGSRYVASGSMYRYGYQGQERDLESGLTNFELRQYDPRLGRWNNPDPYGQHHSPYLAMSNDPVNSVDPDGGEDFEFGYYLSNLMNMIEANNNFEGIDGADDIIYKTWNKKINDYETSTVKTHDTYDRYIYKGGILDGEEYFFDLLTNIGEWFGNRKGESAVGSFEHFLKLGRSKATNLVDAMNDWLTYTPEIEGERPINRGIRLGAGFSKEARKEYASGGMDMYNVNRAALNLVTSSRNSVWLLNSLERGLRIEAQLGGNLPKNFPVIDKFADGVATSIKSIDVTLPSATNLKSFNNLMRTYVNKLANFEGGRLSGVTIKAGDIQSKVLLIAVQAGKVTRAQQKIINNIIKYGKDAGVQVNITKIK